MLHIVDMESLPPKISNSPGQRNEGMFLHTKQIEHTNPPLLILPHLLMLTNFTSLSNLPSGTVQWTLVSKFLCSLRHPQGSTVGIEWCYNYKWCILLGLWNVNVVVAWELAIEPKHQGGTTHPFISCRLIMACLVCLFTRGYRLLWVGGMPERNQRCKKWWLTHSFLPSHGTFHKCVA